MIYKLYELHLNGGLKKEGGDYACYSQLTSDTERHKV